jgi:hypothetical protein
MLLCPITSTARVSYHRLLKHFSAVLPELHWLDSAWLVHWYSLRADPPKTLLATSVLLSRHVHIIITQASHWSAACCPATRYKHLPYCCMMSPAHALYSITSHVHAQTRRKRFHCIVASSCWVTTWPLFCNALSKFVTVWIWRSVKDSVCYS